jgi:hypothetical protein
MTAGTDFPGQPGDPSGDPQADLTISALHEALDHLCSAAHAVECTLPEAGRFVDDHLGRAALVAFGFAADSDEARGLHLLIGAVTRAKETAS